MNTIEANQIIHGQLARLGEYDKSPHFFPENKDFVENLFYLFFEKYQLCEKDILLDCLDLGCGTGFMYEIFNRLEFTNYTGIDITDDMLKVFEEKYPEAKKGIGNASALSFPNSSFTLVSNYSFLDHLDELDTVFCEAFRVLKPKGVFYSGLIPNALYSQNLLRSNDVKSDTMGFAYADHLAKDLRSMLDNGSVYSQQYGFDPDVLKKAEPLKTDGYGMTFEHIQAKLTETGFTKIVLCPNWFFGQANVKKDLNNLQIISEFLRQLGSVSLPLFKYFDIFAIKP